MEPSCLGARAALSRDVAREVWGEAAAAAVIAALPTEDRAFFLGPIEAEWVPERHLVAWIDAIWRGPCASRDLAALKRWSFIITERGFGQARALITGLSSPWVVLRRSQELWRGEHSSGTLDFARLDTNRARLSLGDHPYVTNEASRIAIAEAFRCIIGLSGGTEPTETHEVDASGALQVILDWK